MMKKLIILSAMALMAFTATAQKGAFYIGASNISFFTPSNNSYEVNGLATGISNISYGDYSITSYGIAPELGYYVSDRVAIGGVIGFGGYSIKDSDDSGFGFEFSPYVRYFLYQGETFGFYLQGNVSILYQDLNDAKLTTWGLGINPGVSYALSTHFSLSASFGVLGYLSQKAKGASDALNTFALNLDASTLNFSLRYTF
jgi:outer membrane protein